MTPLTTDQKLQLVVKSKEVSDAIKLLALVYEDCGLEHFIRFTFKANEKTYEVTFLEVGTPTYVEFKPTDK